MISSLEVPKTVDTEWVPKRAEALHALPSCTFKQRMRYQGVEYTTALRVQFGCITVDHHHLWGECKQKGCVACPWRNKHGVKDLFLHKGGCLNQVRGPHKFQGVSNLEKVYIIGVIGRTLPPAAQHELLQVIAHVARRYNPGSLPPDSRKHRRLVRGRFLARISPIGREARTVLGRLAGGMVLPLPLHSLVLAYCRMVHLCYSCTNLSTCLWRAIGMVCTYIVHIIREFAKEGCTATLYMHGWSHTWFNPSTPMLFSDEAGERDLRVAKRYAHVTSIQQDANFSETLKHELYQKLVRKKQKVPSSKIWAPVHRNVVLEACMVAANVLWRTIVVRLLHHLFELQEAGGCTILMHIDTRSVKCTFVGAKEEVDVFCVFGNCGAKRGMRRWVSTKLETIQAWPTLGLKSCA